MTIYLKNNLTKNQGNCYIIKGQGVLCYWRGKEREQSNAVLKEKTVEEVCWFGGSRLEQLDIRSVYIKSDSIKPKCDCEIS